MQLDIIVVAAVLDSDVVPVGTASGYPDRPDDGHKAGATSMTKSDPARRPLQPSLYADRRCQRIAASR